MKAQLKSMIKALERFNLSVNKMTDKNRWKLTELLDEYCGFVPTWQEFYNITEAMNEIYKDQYGEYPY